jgi:REP element-mobilizing transposase RayT
MPGIRPNFDPTHLYFITTVAARHAHLFQRDVIKRIIVDSLNYMRASHWLNLYCFVVMPNHVHFIVRLVEGYTLANIMRDFKKHTSKQIIRQYQAEDNQGVLESLERMAQNIKDQRYKVWEDGYDARDVFTPHFLRQKMEYVHNNPCQPHWRLAKCPEDYVWSSARFYLLDKPAVITVDDVRDLMTG